MTHEEEFDAFLGPANEEDEDGLCSGCHDYPCRCDDWDDEMPEPTWPPMSPSGAPAEAERL